MASVAQSVKDLIYNKVNSLPSIQVVYKHEEIAPSGFPCVSMVATGQDGEFATTAENSRVYSYRVFVHYPIGESLTGADSDRLDNADDIVSTVIDQIIGIIDDNYTLDDNTGATVLFVEAADSEYQYTQLSNGWVRSAVCTLRVHTSYLLSNAV